MHEKSPLQILRKLKNSVLTEEELEIAGVYANKGWRDEVVAQCYYCLSNQQELIEIYVIWNDGKPLKFIEGCCLKCEKQIYTKPIFNKIENE